MKICLFYIETDYQFLQSLGLILEWRESQNIGFGEVFYIIDATDSKTLFLNRQILEEELAIQVTDIKLYSFYLDATLSFFITYKFRKFSGCNFFMFNNRSPIVNKLSSIFSATGNVFQVEEGLSLYRKIVARPAMKNIASIVKKILISSLTFSRFSDIIGDTVYSGTVFLRYDSLARECEHLMFKKILKLPSLQTITSKSWLLNKLYNADDIALPNLKKQYIIYFGQPLSELGILGFQVEIGIIKRIEKAVRSLGMVFLVKPHPIESLSKYSSFDCEVIPGNIPAEVIFLNFSNVKGVVSFYSTAALNISDLLGVRSYFLYDSCNLNVNFPVLENTILIKSFDHGELCSLFSREQF